MFVNSVGYDPVHLRQIGDLLVLFTKKVYRKELEIAPQRSTGQTQVAIHIFQFNFLWW